MASPDFMYPQPTDDELAAQQPRTEAPGTRTGALGGHAPASGGDHGQAIASEAAPSGASSAEANHPRLGSAALAIAITAAGISLITSIILALTIGPMEATYGYNFSDIPTWHQNVAITLFGLQALCAALGITGLIMGIVSAVTDRGRTQAIVATAIAVMAPFVSFGLFMTLSFALA